MHQPSSWEGIPCFIASSRQLGHGILKARLQQRRLFGQVHHGYLLTLTLLLAYLILRIINNIIALNYTALWVNLSGTMGDGC